MVTKKMALMSEYVHSKVFEKDATTGAYKNSDTLEIAVKYQYMALIVDYCAKFDYSKIKSTLAVPMSCNTMQENVSPLEYSVIKDVCNNLDDLQNLFVIVKLLKIWSLYELLAASIACFFKSRSD